jgi:hypothetical protein
MSRQSSVPVHEHTPPGPDPHLNGIAPLAGVSNEDVANIVASTNPTLRMDNLSQFSVLHQKTVGCQWREAV